MSETNCNVSVLRPYTTHTMMVSRAKGLEIVVTQCEKDDIVRFGVYPSYSEVWLSRSQLETLQSTIGAYLQECDIPPDYKTNDPVRVEAICK